MAAQPFAASAEVRVALVVANSAYKDAPLGNPSIDADLVGKSLAGMGFRVTVVKDADLAGFDEALQTFRTNAAGADTALFYFAGHGFALNDGLQPRNYLMSTSAEISSKSDRVIKAGGIALDEIVDQLTGQARATLVFVDACRNDPRLRRGGSVGRGLARLGLTNTANIFVGLSTRLGETAIDGDAGRGSPFARAFAAKMPVPGMRLDDAFTEIRKAVSTETGGAQRPEVSQNDLDSALVLVSLPPAGEPKAAPPAAAVVPAARPTLAEHTEWEAVKASGDRNRIRAFLDAHPASPWRAEAEQALATLEPADKIAPEPSKPEAAKPEAAKPEAAKPEAAKPAPSKPEAGIPPVIRPPRPKRAPVVANQDRAQPARPRPRPAQPRSGGNNCFSFNGSRFCE